MGLDGSVGSTGERSVIFAGDYLNKLSGEQIEYECKRRLEAGCKELVVNFSKTEIVNSIGISILLGVIDIGVEQRRNGRLFRCQRGHGRTF